MGGRPAGNVPLASLLVRLVRIALAIILRDIARRAGVGLGTLYGHFPTREALLEALLRKSFDELTAKAGKLETSRSPEEAFMSCGRFTEMHPLAFLDPGAFPSTDPVKSPTRGLLASVVVKRQALILDRWPALRAKLGRHGQRR
jgi:AcrR family transcriptional regulator